ncbi:MAG: hypothetical protein AAFU67_16850 [Bacteroidota bacterium]
MNDAPDIRDFIREKDLSLEVTIEAFPNTKKRFTRMCNNPETATLEEILFLASRLGVHPTLLVNTYRLGTDTLSSRTHQLLQEHRDLSQTHSDFNERIYPTARAPAQAT